jgi:hypothetical protein
VAAAHAEAAANVSGQRSPMAWDSVTSDATFQASAADPSLLVAAVVIVIFLICVIQSGRTSAPRLPRALQTNCPSISDSRTSSAHRSALSVIEWLHV